MGCEFTRTFSGLASDLVLRAQSGIGSLGGTLTGDATGGDFDVPTAVGRVVGRYAVDGQTARFTIVKKPFLVGCGTIQSRFDEFVNEGAELPGAVASDPSAREAARSGRVIDLSGSLVVFDDESRDASGQGTTDTIPFSVSGTLSRSQPRAQVLFVSSAAGTGGRVDVRGEARLAGDHVVALQIQVALHDEPGDGVPDADAGATLSLVVPAGGRAEARCTLSGTDRAGSYVAVNVVAANPERRRP